MLILTESLRRRFGFLCAKSLFSRLNILTPCKCPYKYVGIYKYTCILLAYLGGIIKFFRLKNRDFGDFI